MQGIKIMDVSAHGSLTPSMEAVLGFLRKAPVDEIYTVRHLASETNFSPDTLGRQLSVADFKPYRVKHGNRYLYGNPVALRKLRRSLETR